LGFFTVVPEIWELLAFEDEPHNHQNFHSITNRAIKISKDRFARITLSGNPYGCLQIARSLAWADGQTNVKSKSLCRSLASCFDFMLRNLISPHLKIKATVQYSILPDPPESILVE
jgi:hypothetical protein